MDKIKIIHLTIMTSVKVCNFSCSCIRDDCSFKHRVDDLELRKEFKNVIEANFDKSIHNETDPDGIRHIPCIHGFLCNNENCGFIHRCSFDGRIKIQKAWFSLHPRPERKQLTIDDANKLKKLVDKYHMNHDDGELVGLFSKLIRHV